MAKLRASGGYRTLHSFQLATVIYDATVDFCAKCVPQSSRTVDQMIQAARSGRQNIAEGSRAGATSSQTELRLVNVARASLEELLLDYEDFLRQRGYPQWVKDSSEAVLVRGLWKNRTDWADQTDSSWRVQDDAHKAMYAPWLGSEDPHIRANAAICLIHQANFLLDKQIAAMEREFVEGGGYSEILAKKRLEHRQQNDRIDLSDVLCPQCGKPMVVRTVKTGERTGSKFWGCSGYPECKGVREL